MNIINITFVSLICFSILGCATKNAQVTKSINSTRTKGIQLKKEIPDCRVLFNKKSPSQSKIDKCIYTVNEISTPQFIDRLLKYKPSVPKETLGKITNTLTNYDTYTKHIGALKKLIQAGASTDNVNIPYIWHNNDFACSSVMVVLKNNLHLYKNKNTLQSKPKGVIPDHTSKNRVSDLYLLANTTDGKSICSNAVKFLAGYNPKLLNNKKFNPFEAYLSDRHHPQWNITTAKLLMTKENSKQLSLFFPATSSSSSETSKWDLILLKEILRTRGRVITLKEKEWLKIKQPDLLSALNINKT